jgi:hypothetical protein
MSPNPTTPRPVFMTQLHASKFRPDFLEYIAQNVHVYEAFEAEALHMANIGCKHYGARRIMEHLRHDTAKREVNSDFKFNDWWTPHIARLFALMNPQHADLFSFREAKSVKAARADDNYGAGLRSAFEAMGASA